MFDLVPASTQYATVPATVTNNSVLTVAMECQPDFLPADATANYFFLCATANFYLRHGSTANQLVGYMDGRSATYDCTGLWVAGQRVNLIVEFNKAAGTIEVTLNGSVLTPSYSGSAGTTAIGALYIGSNASATNLFDGDIGAVAVWNRGLTATEKLAFLAGQPAKECAVSGLQWSAPFDINEKADFAPGGEEATMVGSPLISQHPLILRRGARVMVEGFQSANGTFENPGWVLTGTPTAGTLLESVAAPAGTHPALGAKVLRYKHTDTENALYVAKAIVTGAVTYVRFQYRPVSFAGTSHRIFRLRNASFQDVVIVQQSAVGTIQVRVFVDAAWTLVTLAGKVSADRFYAIEIKYDLAGRYSFAVDGVVLDSGTGTLTRGAPTWAAIGHDVTVSAGEYYLAALDIRSDRAPDALYDGAFDLDGTNDYLTAPQAVAEAILNKGGLVCYLRPDWTPAEAATRSIFGIDVGTSAIYAIRLSSGNIVRLLNNGRLKDFAVTGLWASGQWLIFIFAWDKDTDTLRMWLNGTEITGSISGTWGAQAVSSVLAFGANEVGANKVDGGIGRIALLNDVPTAGEIAALSDGLHPRQVCPTKWVESWKPGSLTGEKGVYNLTTVGAPAIDQGPGIQDAFGAVEVRSHFEGVGYEQPWTAAGTPTADTFIDPDAAAPAGWPAWAGKPCRFKQLATENAMSISKVLSASDLDTCWYREVLYVNTLPGGGVIITAFRNGTPADTLYSSITSGGNLALNYFTGAGFTTVTLITGIAVGRCHYVEIGYSVSGQWVAYRVNGHLGNKPYTYITGVTLDRGGMRSLYLRTSTVTTYSIDMYRGVIEGRTDGPSLVPPYSGATMRNRMMLVGT